MSALTTTPAAPERKRRAGALLALALVGAVGLGGTTALFTDTEELVDNTFAAGTFDLTAGQVEAVFDMEILNPGDSRSFDVAVGNGGTLDLRYAVEAHLVSAGETSTNLGEALTVTVTDAEGATLYSTAAAGDLASATGIAIIGDKAAGGDPGDRLLVGGTPGATETLTFTVAYPAVADNTHMGADTEVKVNFFAEQTANND